VPSRQILQCPTHTFICPPSVGGHACPTQNPAACPIPSALTVCPTFGFCPTIVFDPSTIINPGIDPGVFQQTEFEGGDEAAYPVTLHGPECWTGAEAAEAPAPPSLTHICPITVGAPQCVPSLQILQCPTRVRPLCPPSFGGPICPPSVAGPICPPSFGGPICPPSVQIQLCPTRVGPACPPSVPGNLCPVTIGQPICPPSAQILQCPTRLGCPTRTPALCPVASGNFGCPTVGPCPTTVFDPTIVINPGTVFQQPGQTAGGGTEAPPSIPGCIGPVTASGCTPIPQTQQPFCLQPSIPGCLPRTWICPLPTRTFICPPSQAWQICPLPTQTFNGCPFPTRTFACPVPTGVNCPTLGPCPSIAGCPSLGGFCGGDPFGGFPGPQF